MANNELLVSLHLPKTAGTSFMATLNSRFPSTLLTDYADLPINTPPFERNQSALQSALGIAETFDDAVECVHGHFLPVKYLLLGSKQKLRFITWMRNPVERVVSHYFYWQRTFNPSNAPRLHRQVMEEAWSLERFCLGPEMRNLYGQFLWAFPIQTFDFVGITEFYRQDLDYFSSKFLGHAVAPQFLNVNEDAGADGYEISTDLRSRIERMHAEDMALYNYALSLRANKLSASDQ